MKQIKLKGLSLVLLLLCSVSMWAYDYDFTVDGIYYNINEDDTTVSVTYKFMGTTAYTIYTGDIVIPSTVSYNGKEYTVTGIGYEAFNHATELTSVTIPSSVKYIGKYAFYGTSTTPLESLVKVKFEEESQLDSIGDYVFYYCTSLDSIEIPSSVKTIGQHAFYNCSSLRHVTYNATNCTTMATNETSNPFCGCDALTSITIGDGVEVIPIYLFDGYNSNYFPELKSITIPSSVKTIADRAFSYCEYLETVTFEDNSQLDSIGDHAFYYCSSLKSIVIPDGVNSIGGNAFAQCTSLEEVYTSNITPAECCGTYVFMFVPSTCVLYVPVGSEDDYSNYSGEDKYAWNYFTDVTGVYYASVADNVITLKAPTESEISCDGIAADDEVVVVANVSGSMTVTVYDTESEDNTLYNGEIENVDSISAGTYKYTWTCPSDVTFYEDHTYKLDIALSESEAEDAAEIGSATLITYIGTTENIELESVTPDESDAWTAAENTDIVLTFSGLVKIDEDNTFIIDETDSESEDEETGSRTLAIAATGDDVTEDGYSTQWTITVSGGDISDFNGSTITISVLAVNQNGDTVFDENGDEITLSYTINIPSTGINAINAAVSVGAEVYNLSGQRIGSTVKGVNIIKNADGSVKKVLVK